MKMLNRECLLWGNVLGDRFDMMLQAEKSFIILCLMPGDTRLYLQGLQVWKLAKAAIYNLQILLRLLFFI